MAEAEWPRQNGYNEPQASLVTWSFLITGDKKSFQQNKRSVYSSTLKHLFLRTKTPDNLPAQ